MHIRVAEGYDARPARAHHDTGESFVEWWAESYADGGRGAALNTTFADGVYARGIAGLRTALSS